MGFNEINVKELYDYLAKEIAAGHGDYKIFVTDDEEANGYHALYYLGEIPAQMDPDTRKYCEENNSDLSLLGDDLDKAIYLG